VTKEQQDRLGLGEVAKVSDVTAPHLISHYLYLPTREAAASVANELCAQGFETEERLGADGTNWLVLAGHKVVPSEDLIAANRRLMEALAEKFGGEYDGWEVEIRRDAGVSSTRH
jgi:regulator of RNase E activity RraB